MQTTYYKLTYNDANHNQHCFRDFNKYSLNEAIQSYNFLKSNKLLSNIQLFIVNSHEQELTEDQFPVL